MLRHNRSNRESRTKVAMVAGTLATACRATRIQSTVRAAAWTIVPVALVEAANNKSVPTAVVGWTPNSRMSSGVIMPTNTPTQKTWWGLNQLWRRSRSRLRRSKGKRCERIRSGRWSSWSLWRAICGNMPIDSGPRHICCHNRHIKHVLVHSREQQLNQPSSGGIIEPSRSDGSDGTRC